jgi:hypothetical protein
VRLSLATVGTVALATSALATATLAGPRSGKVVRVARESRGLAASLRFCTLESSGFGQPNGKCYGPAPQVGDVVTALGEDRVVAVVRLTSVTPSADPACPDSGEWAVAGNQLSGLSAYATTSAVIGLQLDPHTARLATGAQVNTGRQAGVDAVAMAIDANGDGNADYAFVAFQCDDGGSPTPPAAATSYMCLEWYMLTGRTTERVRQDRSRLCL